MDNKKIAKELIRIAKFLVSSSYIHIPTKFKSKKLLSMFRGYFVKVDNDKGYLLMESEDPEEPGNEKEIIFKNDYKGWKDTVKKYLQLPINLNNEFDKWVKETMPNANINRT